MSLMTLSVQHGHTFDEARTRLETAVHEVTSRFGTLVQRVEFWIEMQVDAQVVHVSADIPVLGSLLGGSVTTRLKEILERTFQHQLPGGTGQSERVRP
jgi:hypothetical protein